jgi:hypothetical protein
MQVLYKVKKGELMKDMLNIIIKSTVKNGLIIGNALKSIKIEE